MSTTHTISRTAPLAFVDTETTGLDPQRHEVWEIAVILRLNGIDSEHLWQIRPPEGHLRFIADPEALKINRYQERIAVPERAEAVDLLHPDGPKPRTVVEAATGIACVLEGAVMVGSNPAFDAAFLRRLLGLGEPPWHYRTVDITTLAVGALYGRASEWTRRECDATWYSKVAKAVGWPWKSYDVSRHVEVEPPAQAAAHTALGDARWARDVWDAVTVPDAFYTASDEQLAHMADEAMSRMHGGEK